MEGLSSSSSSSSPLEKLLLFSSDDERPTLIVSAVQKVVETILKDEGCSSAQEEVIYSTR
ncbi:hypothetical protein Hanom_Chr07g00586481 [Helianthus anomalus]